MESTLSRWYELSRLTCNGFATRRSAAESRRPLLPKLREPSVAELEELGLGVIVRPFLDITNQEVRRVYCRTCGLEVDPSRRHVDDDWSLCPQGCNGPRPARAELR